MNGFIVDGSFGLVEQGITGAQLVKIGAAGVIGYVSPNPAKNLTARMLDDYLSSGLHVGLVWENGETDMRTPADGGFAGQEAVVQARAIGYDTSCVISAAADWNVQAGELSAVNQYMANFRRSVEHPGIYSNQRTLDMLAVTGNAKFFWQSNSKSFSNGTSTHAHLQQLYNDSRARSLPVDINDVIRTPLGMMGDTALNLDTEAQAFILKAIGAGARAAATLVHQDDDGTQARTVSILQQVTADSGVLAQLKSLADAAHAGGTPIDYDELAHALATHLLVQVSSQ